MRFAKVTFTAGALLFAAGAAAVVGTWALAVSTVAMLAAGLVAVIVMEERDHGAIEGLYPAGNDPVDDLVAEPVPGAAGAEAA
jgi:hypothetical protein